VCQIEGGASFSAPLPFKDEEGTPLEPGGTRSGYYIQGVRVVSDAVFIIILSRAESLGTVPSGLLAPSTDRKNIAEPGLGGGFYASPSAAREVETQSRSIAVAFLLAQHPGARIDRMPTNHPGYDMETDIAGSTFVEVKGTQAATPRFLLSEGERLSLSRIRTNTSWLWCLEWSSIARVTRELQSPERRSGVPTNWRRFSGLECPHSYSKTVRRIKSLHSAGHHCSG
jgi:hypothetical protein